MLLIILLALVLVWALVVIVVVGACRSAARGDRHAALASRTRAPVPAPRALRRFVV
jgi:hypothetical protein